MNDFKCSHCGKCCIAIPCIFAQVRHHITSSSDQRCPDLIEGPMGYECRMISSDAEMMEVMIDGYCDNPELADEKPTFSAGDIVKEFFPGITDDDINYILWNKTGYPIFFNIPEDGWTNQQYLRTQVKRLSNSVKVPVW